MAQRNGTGMFLREVMNRFPLLPLEEGRVNDLSLRENFIEWVFAWQFACGKLHDRMDEMLDDEPTPGGFVTGTPSRVGKLYTAHKLTLMAHSPKPYTGTGRLVADAGRWDWHKVSAEYSAQFMKGLLIWAREASM